MNTVLIVDDEPVIRSLIVRYLTKSGYFVLEAATSNEARQVADSFDEEIDLAIVDHTLADRRESHTGLEVALAIAKSHRSVQILLISGYAEEQVLSRLESDAVKVAFLQKPFTCDILLAKVQELLRGSQARTTGM
jgi:two-component system cell cycle sensor histidine kinase/response regulator CckA